MKEKTTDELLNILQGCSNLSHLEDTLQILPEQSEYTFTSYLSKLLIEKNISKAKVISEANLARTYGYQIFQGDLSIRLLYQKEVHLYFRKNQSPHI